MAKSKGGKKKSKGKRPKGTNSKLDGCVASSSSSVDHVNDTQLIWSAADECDHYAALGCHIANIARCKLDESKPSRHKSRCTTQSSSYTCSEYRQMYQTAMQQYPWLLDIERFDPSDYHPEDLEHIPDVAMNDGDDEDEQMILTLTNTKNTTNICYVTVYDVDLWDANGNTLTSGVTSTTISASTNDISSEDDTGEKEGNVSTSNTTEMKCTTFIILCPPQTFVHLCSLAPNQTLGTTEKKILITSWSQVRIESDIQAWSFHPKMEDEHPYLLHFPFCGTMDSQEEVSEDNTTTIATAYQCTQSEDGQLTHFFHGNYHAIDFACTIGTPLFSPVNGIVVDVRDNSVDDHDGGKEVSGIAASNMFHWNSIMIQVDDEDVDAKTNPLYVEFVHIQSKSCVVQTGDTVQKGQLICRSGSVGFSPEPHLHLAAYRSIGNDASTVRVRFESIGNSPDRSFLPRTGGWYNQSGLIPNYNISSVDT